MKKFLRVLVILLMCCITSSMNAQSGATVNLNYVPNPYHPANQNAIEDGWYEAIVKYSSHTGEKSTYTLYVKVERLMVVAIDFGNGGSVHNGRNNSGYYYRGGALFFERDRNGNVIAANATVDVSYINGGWQRFQIYIQ